MTMFNKEMIEAASVNEQLAEHMKAVAATYAALAFEASVAKATEAKAKAEAEAQAQAQAKAEAEVEAEAQSGFLAAYSKGYVYVATADEAANLINSADEVGLHARAFVEEVIGQAFIKVVFMRPKKGGRKA